MAKSAGGGGGMRLPQAWRRLWANIRGWAYIRNGLNVSYLLIL